MQRRNFLVYIFFFLFSAGILFAQAPDTLWTKRYSLGPIIYGGIFHTLQPLADGSWMAAGSIVDYNDPVQLEVATWMHIDSTGKVLRSMFYDYEEAVDETPEVVFSADQEPDGGFVYAGQSGYRALLIKTDQSGDTLWTRRFGDGNAHVAAFSVICGTDSNYVMAGCITDSDTITSVFIMKVSADGDSLWSKTYGGLAADTAKAIVQASDGGYVITGQRLVSGTDYDLFIMKVDENGDSVWAKHYGTPQREQGNTIVRTEDNGYFIGGVQHVTGMNDEMFMIRTDSLGDTLWTKSMGNGNPDDEIYGACLVPGQGFIISGKSQTSASCVITYIARLNTNGDVLWTNMDVWGGYTSVGIDSNNNVAAAGWLYDYSDQCLVCLLDSDSGYIVRRNRIAWTEYENVRALEVCHDNSYIVTGWKKNYPKLSDFDILLMKIGSNGDSVWTKIYGGWKNDIGYDVKQTTDNGYVIVGTTFSFGAGRCDVCLLKTNESGTLQWMKTYGLEDWDIGYSVIQTNDLGYVITGQSYHRGSNCSDVYVIRTNMSGDVVWTRIYRTMSHDIGYAVCPGISGGFLIGGYTLSCSELYEGALFIKTDDNGNVLWKKIVRGAMVQSIIPASDSGYIAVGTKERDGMAEYNDLCFVKIDDDGNVAWIKSYGIYNSEVKYNEGNSITPTSDGGYVGAGYSALGNGIYLVRVDQNGDSLWTKCITWPDFDYCSFINDYTVRQTPDMGFVVAGGSNHEYGFLDRGDHHIIMVRLGLETGCRDIQYAMLKKPFLSVYPTIFRYGITINYQSSAPDKSDMNIYDIAGRLIKTFDMNDSNDRGSFFWHGFNNNGLPVPSGVYYVHYSTVSGEIVKKVLLMR